MVRRPPMRSCVACRTAREKHELLRVVRAPAGQVEPDLGGRLPGRGAYVCRSVDCISSAVARGALSRALETAIPAGLLEQLTTTVTQPVTPGGARGQE